MAESSVANSDSTPGKTAADPASPPWMRRVPMVTGALAALAGFLTVRGAELSHVAIYRDTTAVLYQSKASDKWTEYQADSLKKHGDATALMTSQLSPDQRAKLEAEEKDFAARQPGLRDEAQRLESASNDERSNGVQLLAEKDLTDYAGMAAQLGIALASVAALTRRFEVFAIGTLCGVAAALITGWSFAVHFHLWAVIRHLLHV